jgi:hypothetical protein
MYVFILLLLLLLLLLSLFNIIIVYYSIYFQERLEYGPDIYDFLELYHESHIVYSYSMKDYQKGSIVDCMDKHGNWLAASISEINFSQVRKFFY